MGETKMDVLDIVVTNNSIKRDAEQQRKEVVLHKKHVVDTIAILNGNIEFIKFAVAKYRNSEKYDYLYNLVANKYNFKMADDKAVDEYLAKNGIYRTKAFESKKMRIFTAIYAAVVAVCLILSYYIGIHAIIGGFIVLSIMSIIFACIRKNLLENRNFYKVQTEYSGE